MEACTISTMEKLHEVNLVNLKLSLEMMRESNNYLRETSLPCYVLPCKLLFVAVFKIFTCFIIQNRVLSHRLGEKFIY